MKSSSVLKRAKRRGHQIYLALRVAVIAIGAVTIAIVISRSANSPSPTPIASIPQTGAGAAVGRRSGPGGRRRGPGRGYAAGMLDTAIQAKLAQLRFPFFQQAGRRMALRRELDAFFTLRTPVA